MRCTRLEFSSNSALSVYQTHSVSPPPSWSCGDRRCGGTTTAQNTQVERSRRRLSRAIHVHHKMLTRELDAISADVSRRLIASCTLIGCPRVRVRC